MRCTDVSAISPKNYDHVYLHVFLSHNARDPKIRVKT